MRHEGHEMKLKFMTPRHSQEGSTHGKGENRKRRNINYRRMGNWGKKIGRKDKDDG